jgi:hypothetical protein
MLHDLVATCLHLYKQGCCTHILDLLLEDWGKEDMFKTLIIRAKPRGGHWALVLEMYVSPKIGILKKNGTKNLIFLTFTIGYEQ